MTAGRSAPEGGICLPPPLAIKKRKIVRAAQDCLASAGFSPIELPILEYAPKEAGVNAEDRCTFVAPDGKLLMLRYDHTTSLIRFIATTDALSLPARLCYEGQVFRRRKELAGYREIGQLGAEILGPDGIDADIEILRVLMRTIESLGVPDFLVDIGTVEVFKGLVAGTSVDARILNDIRFAILRKDTAALAKALKESGLPAAKQKALTELPTWFGGPEVFEKAGHVVDNDRSRKGLQRLKSLYDGLIKEGLAKKHLSVDLGVVQSLDYYTGIVFEAYVRNLGSPIASGGRYDRLGEEYGKSIPATGFALNLEPLLDLL